jgi:hypothetical protein
MSIVNRNDRHDLDPTEAKLIRTGHYLWKLYQQANSEAGLEDSLACVWAAKRIVRQEVELRREAAARKLREYWEQRAAA